MVSKGLIRRICEGLANMFGYELTKLLPCEIDYRNESKAYEAFFEMGPYDTMLQEADKLAVYLLSIEDAMNAETRDQVNGCGYLTRYRWARARYRKFIDNHLDPIFVPETVES